MGYSGLNSASESDTASDLFFEVALSLSKIMEKHYKEYGAENENNTNATINCGFFFRDILVPAMKHYIRKKEYIGDFFGNKRLVYIAMITQGNLHREIEDASIHNKENWEDEQNRVYHRNVYKSMLKSVEFYLDRIKYGM